jgi:hypothetical protein
VHAACRVDEGAVGGPHAQLAGVAQDDAVLVAQHLLARGPVPHERREQRVA